jgi:hypothetical protein
MTGAPVYMPWAIPAAGHNAVKSVLQMWYPGQRGGIATANVLLGIVNPGGKLPETFPVDATHYPQFEATCSQSAQGSGSSASNVGTCSLYPGVYMPGFLMTASSGVLHNYRTINFSNSTLLDNGVSANPTLTYPDAAASVLPIPTTTGNGIFTGYRWYDENNVAPLFEFGRGLSYTTFAYSNLVVGPGTGGAAVDVSFDLKNTGSVAGDEVAQVYVGAPAGAPVPMSSNALGAFQRVTLAAGATTHLTLHLQQRSFQYWKATAPNFLNNNTDGWTTAPGCRTIAVGSSSRDHRMHEVATQTGAGSCPDITTLTQDFATTMYGHPVTFTANVVGSQPDPAHVATGFVQFTLDGLNMGAPVALDATATAVLTTSSISLGTHVVAANYLGDTSYTPSSASVTHIVRSKLTTSTVVTSDIHPSVFGQVVTFTALVSPENLSSGFLPTGTVQFKIDGHLVGAPVPLNASFQASYSTAALAVGGHSIRATYSGDAHFSSSVANSIGQTVSKAHTTTSLVTLTNPYSAALASTNYTATVLAVGPGAGIVNGGTIQFKMDGTNLGAPVAVAAGSATLHVNWILPTGNHVVRAVFSGNPSFLNSTGPTTTQKINP